MNDLADLLEGTFLTFAVDLKLIYSCSDIESLKHHLSVSWTWSVENQVPLSSSKSNQLAVGHQRSPL